MVSVAGVQVRPRSIPKVRHRMTPMLSAGPIRTDPRPTPTTSVRKRATTTTLATMPGRPRSRPVKPTDRAALGIVRTDTYPLKVCGGIEMSGQIAEVSARSRRRAAVPDG
jgi:hypothetical protein